MIFLASDESAEMGSTSSLGESQQDMSLMDVDSVSSSDSSRQNLSCPICKKVVRDDQASKVTICGCKFHIEHWNKWSEFVNI